MKEKLYNQNNEVVGEVVLKPQVFDFPWRPDIVREVLVAYQANKRRPWAHTKGRGEVRGGGRKPWRQKGLGRARHGSIRSPLWRGGGITHGPVKFRRYSQKINRKIKKIALASVLSKKLREDEIRFITSFKFQEPKTKYAAQILRTLLKIPRKSKNFNAVLVPESGERKDASRAARNLPKVAVVSPSNVSIYDLLTHKQVLVGAGALPILESRATLEEK